jgi:low molecular weight protein-tyrosine phosphatase
MANICRSPALSATLRHAALKKGAAERIRVDSCGIGWFHVGQHPDPRAFEAAKSKGILIDHRSQQFRDAFFDEFDLILAVEPKIVEQLKLRAKSPAQAAKIRLATDFSELYKGQPILDPYYMNNPGFDEMMEIALDCSEGILKEFGF